jgi:glycosyltransferase involved in cell wall biosynthesis
VKRTLYISYDGLTDPLGQSQVLPYVLGLARGGFPMAILSFEKPGHPPEIRARMAARLAEADVPWLRRTWHRTPTVPATAFDAVVGLGSGGLEALRGGVRMIHARSYVAGLMGLSLAELLRVPFLFDMRGFWGDERVEGGQWSPSSRVYRGVRALEARLFGRADAVVSLTHAAKAILMGWPEVAGRKVPVEVIPTCADLDAFRPPAPRPPGTPRTVGYLGSFGGRYLTHDTVRLFAAVRARAPDTRFLVVTPRDQAPLWAACDAVGLPRAAVEARAARHDEVPALVARMDATVSLIQPGFASLASCPTKFGESLAAGAPVVVNPGIGDCAETVTRDRVGVVFRPEHDDPMAAAAQLLALLEDPAAPARCRAVAMRDFALAEAVLRYQRLYDRLLA